ncbi:hypothetical protein HanIR_Chr16g0807041 [Helianthus annuus]|nr:hypothetical protein HanIR_Chr16g0807041 [Helianthus annuus]
MVNLNQTNVKQPVVKKNPQGRPTLKAQQERKVDSFVEPSRHSFISIRSLADAYGDSVGIATQESYTQPARHRPFVQSQSDHCGVPTFIDEIAKGARQWKGKQKVAKSMEEALTLPLLPSL